MYDGVFVNIEAALTNEKVLGADPADRPPRIIGDTYFFAYGQSKPLDIVNVGAEPFHAVDVVVK